MKLKSYSLILMVFGLLFALGTSTMAASTDFSMTYEQPSDGCRLVTVNTESAISMESFNFGISTEVGVYSWDGYLGRGYSVRAEVFGEYCPKNFPASVRLSYDLTTDTSGLSFAVWTNNDGPLSFRFGGGYFNSLMFNHGKTLFACAVEWHISSQFRLSLESTSEDFVLDGHDWYEVNSFLAGVKFVSPEGMSFSVKYDLDSERFAVGIGTEHAF